MPLPTFVLLDQPEQLPVNNAMIGVIITYLTEGIPQEVSNEWTLWSDRIQKVPTNAIDPAGPFPSYMTPGDNVHVWTNYLKQYTIPTVEKVDVSSAVTSMDLPVGTLLSLAVLLPLSLQIRKRKQNAMPVRTQVVLVIILIAASLLLYPYVNLSVAKPGAIASRVSDDDAKIILHSLLKNVYRAFDFREEEDVYDKLALSASGDLLADIYLQNRKSFKVKRAGGAQARVKEIDILDAAGEESGDSATAVDINAEWTAMGTVGHWGHIHTRKNRYEAVVTIEPFEGAWKITGLELLEEERLDPYAKKQVSGAGGQVSGGEG